MDPSTKQDILKLLFKAKIEDQKHAIWMLRFLATFFYVMATLQLLGAIVPSEPTDIPTPLFTPGIDGFILIGLTYAMQRFKLQNVAVALAIWTGAAFIKYGLGLMGVIPPQYGQFFVQLSLFLFSLQAIYTVNRFHAAGKD